MKLSNGNTRGERFPRLRSTEVLLERTQPEVEFDPRRDVPKHLWKQLEEVATSTTIPEMKSNVRRFFDSLLELSIIDEKVRDLLASRDDLIQHHLNKLPIITHPERDGLTPGYLQETADLLQVVPELGPTVRAIEKPGPDGYKWYIDNQLDDLNGYLYGRTQPESESNEPIASLLNGLRGSIGVMRLFPADRAELKEELKKINIPNELLAEAQNQLA